MTPKGVRALEAQLRAPPPNGLTLLEEEQLEDLAQAIADTRHRQAAALKEAGDRAFDQIPWLLRGPIRKVLG